MSDGPWVRIDTPAEIEALLDQVEQDARDRAYEALKDTGLTRSLLLHAQELAGKKVRAVYGEQLAESLKKGVH